MQTVHSIVMNTMKKIIAIAVLACGTLTHGFDDSHKTRLWTGILVSKNTANTVWDGLRNLKKQETLHETSWSGLFAAAYECRNLNQNPCDLLKTLDKLTSYYSSNRYFTQNTISNLDDFGITKNGLADIDAQNTILAAMSKSYGKEAYKNTSYAYKYEYNNGELRSPFPSWTQRVFDFMGF